MICPVTALALCLAVDSTVPPAKSPAPPDRRSSGPSFLVARYAGRHAHAMYSGYSVGRMLLVVGLLQNPRSDYREVMAGAAVPLKVPGGSITVAGAGASTNTGWYAQLYVIPTLASGRFSLDVTAQLGEPLSDAGARGVYVSPGNAFVRLGAGFSAGAGYYAGMEEGSRPYHGLGPAVRRAVPHGSVTVEWIAPLTPADRPEARVTLRSTF